MRIYLIGFILCFLCFGFVSAQESEQSPYEIALQRIEEARFSGASRLSLSRLGLEELPPEIGELDSLEWLALDYNQLSSLPPEIGNLSNLQVLSVYENQLSSLPPEIGNLSNLRRLTVSSNKLSSLPAEIGNLRNICHINLLNNQFQYLPSELAKLNTLTVGWYCFGEPPSLVVDNNPLISPPPEVVAQGTAAILEYLRNEAWWHLQRVILGGLSSVGLVAAIILGIRWRQRQKWAKKKRESIK